MYSPLIQDGKKIADQKYIAEHFNNFYTQVLAKFYKKTITSTKKYFLSFLKNPNNKIFFITPTTIEEVNDIISDLKSSKSTGLSSLPIKLMKQLNNTIVSTLFELVNKPFESSIFLDMFQNC